MAKAGDQYSVRTGNIWNFCQRDDVKTVNHLVDEDGIDLALRNKVGWTPLHAAARNGHEAVVSKLLAAGANTNAATQEGLTPLYIAARSGHEAVVSKLLAAGANTNAPTQEG